jgi:phosphoserine phosphatase RsbU/P
LISTLQEPTQPNGNPAHNSEALFKAQFLHTTQKAGKSTLAKLCGCHQEKISFARVPFGGIDVDDIEREDSHQLWRDLQLARELQSGMLPIHHPAEGGRDLAARSFPAHTVGGDFYDFFRYPGKAISAEAICDVSGKGTSAAIYAGLVSGILRSLAPLELGPAEMLSALNKALLTRPIPARYVSMLYATWDEQERVFRIANAGLPYPICVQDGKTFLLKASGLPLGLFESAEYEEHTIQCSEGDLVVFYTDGLTDAFDARNEDFGLERLQDVVAMNASETAERVLDSIFFAVASHAGNLNAFDDQTVIAVRT